MKPQQSSVLYDAPGPRARRAMLLSSLAAAALIAVGAFFLVYRPLADAGQFTSEKWGPLVDPGDEVFGQVWRRVGTGARATLLAAVLAIAGSFVLGPVLAVLRVQLKATRALRFARFTAPAGYTLRGLVLLANGSTRAAVEVFRGMPVVITIFFASRLAPQIGLPVEKPLYPLVIGLTVYNMVVIAEILRSGMEGLPGGQYEAATAIGLSSFQTIRIILLPQAFKIMLPSLISQLVVILKDTSLGFLITYPELLNVGKQLIGVLSNPIQVYFVIGALFILVNYTLSKLAQYVQRRLARSR